MAAGLDPADFWTLTPKLYAIHAAGAQRRLKAAQAGRAEAAWIGFNGTVETLTDYIDRLVGPLHTLPEEALSAGLDNAVRGLTVITLAEVKRQRGLNGDR